MTPTLLALMGLPQGDDMDARVLGRVLGRSFLARRPPESVSTHDTEAWRTARAAESRGAPGQNERLEQLWLFGCIDDRDDRDDRDDLRDIDEDREKPPGRGKNRALPATPARVYNSSLSTRGSLGLAIEDPGRHLHPQRHPQRNRRREMEEPP